MQHKWKLCFMFYNISLFNIKNIQEIHLSIAVFQHTDWTGFMADILIYHSANPKCINYCCIPLCMWVHCHCTNQLNWAIVRLLQGKSTCIFLAVQPYLNPLTKPMLLIRPLFLGSTVLKWLQWNWPVTGIVQGSNKRKPSKKNPLRPRLYILDW